MRKKSELINFFLIGFLCIITTYFSHPFLPAKLSFSLQDLPSWYVYYLSKKSTKPLKLVGIEIDDYSLGKIPQRWPWKRSVYAQLLKKLNQERVYVIGMDLIFLGESADKEDDLALKEAFSSISPRVILAYYFDKNGNPVLPKTEFRDVTYSLGMINAPADIDGRTRRFRGYVKSKENNFYYSFPVQLAAASFKQTPQQVLSRMPLLKDNSFFIKYLIKPQDLLRISFYDVLENLENLKARYGKDFLKGAMVVIYQSSEVLHDIQSTPLGEMPGGVLNINGFADILLNRLLKQNDVLLMLFFALTLLAVVYFLNNFAFLSGFVLTTGALFLIFWSQVILNLIGIRFDYHYVVSFGILFFVLGNLYKYVYFLSQILKIKYKATIDPIRNVFTLRYFYYRMELEQNKIYFGKNLFLVLINLESFGKIVDEYSLDKIKKLWQEINSVISLKGSFWSIYSSDELVGCLLYKPAKIKILLQSIVNNLEVLLQEKGMPFKMRSGCLRLNQKYPLKQLLFIISEQIKEKVKVQEISFFDEKELAYLLSPSHLRSEKKTEILESLDGDIVEMNRQLVCLVEDLKNEHQKTKEAFFQIITSLVNALEARDPYTQGHSERVCNYALKMADKLGWSREEKEKLRKAALLHDIGKIGIHDNILHKKGQLTAEEFDVIKKHEIIGVKILEPLKEFSEILPWILYHHEKWDGKGYPHGLAGDAIPIAAQVISLSDVFDALTTGRDYKKAFSASEAKEEMMKNKGTQFNPYLVDIFVDTILK